MAEQRVYYAHCMALYGSVQESLDLRDLAHVFELPSNLRGRTLSVEATRDWLRECGYR